MRLRYYVKKKNFGDALNSIIFPKLLPYFFDDDPSIDFFGIGSIIGFNMMKDAQQKVIFSSGFASAYASLPAIDSTYDIICVRGPLTANALKLNKNAAVTDGAALLREWEFPKLEKKYKFSFMPHWQSEEKFPWEEICHEAGIHYVSPTADAMQIIDEILKTEVVIAEAMHFAIVADTLRVPWIPVKAYKSINDFKWKDWAMSLGLDYNPTPLWSLYQDHDIICQKVMQKTKNKFPKYMCAYITKSYLNFQEFFLRDHAAKQLKNITKLSPQLSNDSVLNEKTDCLLEKLHTVKQKYQKNSIRIK